MKPIKIPTFTRILMIALALMFLLSACASSTDAPTSTPAATLPVLAEATSLPTQAVPTPMLVDSTKLSDVSVTVEVNGVAQGFTSQVVAASPSGTDQAWWEVMPQYTLVALQGYPISEHTMQPQIFVYPVADLGVNQVAGKVAENLQALLQNQQAGEDMPYLPPYNAAQMMHAQVKYLDFKNGKGVRYLTEFSQGITPVNNRSLLYTFQGLTSDGKYYVAVVLPINLPQLPADESAVSSLPADPAKDYRQYVADTASMLDQQSVGAYTPDMSKLDALVQSIEVK